MNIKNERNIKFFIEYSTNILYFAQNSENRSPTKKWKLVYSPLNDVLQTLMESTIQLLHLDGVVAVNTSAQIEQAMFGSEQLVAGIDFNHLSVRSSFSSRVEFNN